MTVIELPDDQAASLKAKAAAQGLTLEDWFQKLAGDESPARYDFAKDDSGPQNDKLDTRPIWEEIQDILKDVPDEVFDRLPQDGASQVDHYIYGLPKRD